MYIDGGVSKEHHNQPKKLLVAPNLEQFEQSNKVILTYNPEYKVNIHDFILV